MTSDAPDPDPDELPAGTANEPPAGTANDHDAKEADRRHSLRVNVLVGVIAVAGTIGGSLVTSLIATNNQLAVFQEEREKEDRVTRSKTYFEFLEAADEYSRVWNAYDSCAREHRKAGREGREGDICNVREFFRADIALVDVHNRLYVYGSSDAVAAANDLTDALRDNTATVDALLNGGTMDHDEVSRREAAFRTVACEELPANPRSDCS